MSQTAPPHQAEWLLGALASVPALVAVLRGSDHCYTFVNDAMAAVLALEDPVGKPFGSSGHAMGARLVPVLDQVRATGQPWTANEVRIADMKALPREPERFYNVSFVPLRGPDGEVDGILIHSFDVTDLVRTRREVAENEARLRHAQKLESLGVLAGGIAHDFNNMLAAVKGSVAHASLTLDADDAAQPALRDALAAIRRAGDLTRQLLAYSGRGHFAMRRLDLSAQVAELVHLLEATLPKKVHLVLELSPDLPAIEADASQLQQIVMNLVINGAEAIGDGAGTLVVATRASDVDADLAKTMLPGDVRPMRGVVLEVRDSGAGMDEATRLKIFDPFFTTKFTGRGLGLAAVLGIVRAHGAALSVESRSGAGTMFRVYFPAIAGPADIEEVTPSVEGFRAKGLVLVIDDDAGVRTALSRLLEDFGLGVLTAPDGRRGIEALAARAADISAIILDMTMPDMNGVEALRELLAVRPDIRVIVSSGYSEAEVEGRFVVKSSAVAAFLPKPFSPQELVRALRRALSH